MDSKYELQTHPLVFGVVNVNEDDSVFVPFPPVNFILAIASREAHRGTQTRVILVVPVDDDDLVPTSNPSVLDPDDVVYLSEGVTTYCSGTTTNSLVSTQEGII